MFSKTPGTSSLPGLPQHCSPAEIFGSSSVQSRAQLLEGEERDERFVSSSPARDRLFWSKSPRRNGSGYSRLQNSQMWRRRKKLFASSFFPAPKPIRLPWKEGEKIPKGWTREWVEADCPTKDPCRAAGGWVLTKISSLGGTSVISSPRLLSVPSSDDAQSSDCPALHCKRPSLKNRETTICCPLIKGHRGRARSGRPRSGRPRCPRSCD